MMLAYRAAVGKGTIRALQYHWVSLAPLGINARAQGILAATIDGSGKDYSWGEESWDDVINGAQGKSWRQQFAGPRARASQSSAS